MGAKEKLRRTANESPKPPTTQLASSSVRRDKGVNVSSSKARRRHSQPSLAVQVRVYPLHRVPRQSHRGWDNVLGPAEGEGLTTSVEGGVIRRTRDSLGHVGTKPRG